MSVSNGSPASPTVAIPKPTMAEPSMEDILASIRRIIATDHYTAPPAAAPAALGRTAVQPPTLQDETVETLVHPAVAELVTAPELDASIAPELDHSGDAVAHEPAAHQLLDGAPVAAAEPLPAAPEDFEEHVAVHAHSEQSDESEPNGYDEFPVEAGLLSSEAGAVISSSFQNLAETVLFQDPEMIERLAREAIRPLLKQWLDENLPSMVERLVRAEIERVARGGRTRN